MLVFRSSTVISRSIVNSVNLLQKFVKTEHRPISCFDLFLDYNIVVILPLIFF